MLSITTRVAFCVFMVAKVHRDLPLILKEYTKAVIRGNPATEKEIIAFSLQYFKDKSEGKTQTMQ